MSIIFRTGGVLCIKFFFASNCCTDFPLIIYLHAQYNLNKLGTKLIWGKEDWG